MGGAGAEQYREQSTMKIDNNKWYIAASPSPANHNDDNKMKCVVQPRAEHGVRRRRRC